MKRADLLLTLLLVASLVSAATLDLRVEAGSAMSMRQVRSGVENFLFGRMGSRQPSLDTLMMVCADPSPRPVRSPPPVRRHRR